MSVFIQQNKYTGSQDFSQYPFELSDFQKHSVDAIEQNHNVLVAAPTASGKTLVAEHIIKKNSILNNDRKHQVIYTTPIKALSNFLYNDFVNKYPNISFGIMTGDIKFNPEADCVIMTTEILRNLLYNKKIQTNLKLDIEIDVYQNVSAVIFDEVHYISDKSRGRVWEETLILLPSTIQLVMLSATIDKPEIFAKWVAESKDVPVTLTVAEKRVVPLVYFMFNSFLGKLDNIQKNEEDETSILKLNQNLKIVMNEKNQLVGIENLNLQRKMKQKYGKFMATKSLFSNLTLYLQNKNLLPSIVFTLSRKNCELYANQLDTVLNTQEEQSEVINIFESKIHKCSNYRQIQQMKDYESIKMLLSKGIAYHHSGVYHIFKEIIEILLAHKDKENNPKPLIKMLFATETFAIGINIPVKSVSYSGLTKFTDNERRYLLPHEFKQMSGRAGRRGMDKLGVAILLPTLYDLPTNEQLKTMMCGKNQLISSQFVPNYQFLLKLILTGNNQIMAFLKKSLLDSEITKQNLVLQEKLDTIKITDLSNELKQFFEEFNSFEKENLNCDKTKMSQKTIKKKQKQLNDMKKSDMYIQNIDKYNTYKSLMKEKSNLENQIQNNYSYITHTIIDIIEFLQYYKYITNDIDKSQFEFIRSDHITTKGIIASQVNECNEILLTEIICGNYLDDLSKEEITIILSIFIESKLNDGYEESSPDGLTISSKCKSILYDIANLKDSIIYYLPKSLQLIDTNWEIYLNMTNVVSDWVHGKNINYITQKYNIYIGNFVKDIIKLNNIIQSVLTTSEILQNYKLQSICSEIEPLLMRDIVNVDSIYL